MIVRWGLAELPGLLAELEISEPLLVTTRRWAHVELPVERRYDGVRAHVPQRTVREAIELARGSDGLVALGGGSAVDTAKAVSSQTGLPIVSVPTTYAGAEWTTMFGILDEERRVKVGGTGARTEGIVYEVELTLGLPRDESGGTAMNALAHCAEALYVATRNDEGDREALAGAPLIDRALPRVLADGGDRDARRELLEGAAHAGAALGAAGLGLAHAMAQALGGRYNLSHGAMNAVCLPPALRFNEPVVPDAITAFAAALGHPDAAGRCEELARLGGFERLRDFGVPRGDLPEVAAATVVRGGAKVNPRQATPEEVLGLLESIW